MSKVDAQRALREARYARFAAAKAADESVAKPRSKAEPAPAPPGVVELFAAIADAPKAPATEPAAEEATEELCGHMSMNGKSCTRAKGHPQKNHRYS
jgi:hypothetical protein